MKMTFHGRQPQKIKSGISQQPLIGSSSNFKLKLKGRYQILKLHDMKTAFHGRQPSMENDLKLLKVE
jgi:hypothetical protein